MTDRNVALVAGASGGVGREVARQLAQRGDRLVLQYRSNAAPVQALMSELPAGDAIAVQGDLSEVGASDALAARAWSEFGRLDTFVNTVGHTNEYVRFMDMSDEAIDQTIAIELRTIVFSVRAALGSMVRAGNGGRIVLVGSDSGKVGTTGEAVSAACRAAIIGFAKSVAREHARDDILANVVCPGPIETELWHRVTGAAEYSESVANKIVQATPMRRVALASEIADAVVYLTSPQSSFITGQAISVSGGLTMVS